MLVRDMLALFPRLRVVIVGDALLDAFVVGTPTRLCRERPVPVVVKREAHEFPGGAANVAANVRALGAQVRFVSAACDGQTGRRLRKILTERGVALDDVVEAPDARCGSKVRVLADEHYLARIDEEPQGFDGLNVQRALVARLRDAYATADVVIVSDYGGGCVAAPVLRALRELRERRRVPLLVDARDPGRYARFDCDVLTPNLDEAARMLGVHAPDAGDTRAVERLGRGLASRVRAGAVAVTLGGDGVLIAHGDDTARIDARRVTVDNTCGAGDSFASALALAVATGAPVVDAARLGLEAAAVAVAKPFTATVSLAELRERLELLGETAPPAAAGEVDALAQRLAERRERGERIVFTNGVFDLLHAGHVRLLQRARALGDVLVVAVNSDRSARLVKGPNRPINEGAQRRAVLEALDCVDEVVTFDGLTAEALIDALRPDVYVRGDDWRLEDLPEAKAAQRIGARVVLLPRTTDVTTSRIIERVAARTPHWSPIVG